MSKAREAAARAIHDRYEQITHWVKTLGKEPRPMETSGIKEVHRLDANAAIDAFLAALSEDGDLVERVAKAIYDAAPLIRCWPSLVYGRRATTETRNEYASWSEVCADAAIGGDECKRAMNSTRERARAAIAATLKPEALTEVKS